MAISVRPLSAAALLALGLLTFQHIGHSQTPSSGSAGGTSSNTPQSDYIFRFNTGISSVFLSTSTFPDQNPINLGSCTATEQINGPLICAVNCSSVPVCLLNVSGPPGATVNDVLEKVSEVSVTGTGLAGAAASPTPSATAPLQPGSTAFGNMVFRSSPGHDANLSKRIEIYNSAR